MIALTDGRLLDLTTGTFSEPTTLLIDGHRIAAVGASTTDADTVVDARSGYVIPGLIDCHVHVVARATANLGDLRQYPASLVSAAAAQSMQASLRRGFTRLRDTGGADRGLAQAVERGYIKGPTLYYCGRALSQTAGHGDLRALGENCSDRVPFGGIGEVVDGADAVRRAAREQLRHGASHIKVMVTGGVSSETDEIHSPQFSDAEIAAAVEEAAAAGKYVAAHAYTSQAVVRALRLGVRTIEHANLADEDALTAIKQAGAFLVPNLVAYFRHGHGEAAAQLSSASLRKNEQLFEAGVECLELAARLGVKIAYGSDLLGSAQEYQSQEFELRAKVQPVIDIIRSATVTAAELLGLQASVGQLLPGYEADLVVLTGDPLADVRVLSEPAEHISLVLKGGSVVSRSREDTAP